MGKEVIDMQKVENVKDGLLNLNVAEMSALYDCLIKAGIISEQQQQSYQNKDNDEEVDASKAGEKTSFDVCLVSCGDNKLSVIKIIRNLLNIGLGEAKSIAEKGNSIIKEGVSKIDAEKIKEEFTSVGAVVELK